MKIRLLHLLAFLMLLGIASSWLWANVPLSMAQSLHKIGLVVVHGDGSTLTRCVEFSEDALSGYAVLQRAQLPLSVDASSMGTAICAIDGEGCTVPQEDCFCGMNRNPARYWNYWQLVEGAWQYSQLGASNTVVKPGAVEGWLWGTGDRNLPPPLYAFEQICAPATATPTMTLTPLPTDTTTPSPTPTQIPTETPTATPTATPLPTFTATFTPAPTATDTSTLTSTPTPTGTASPTASPPPTPVAATVVAAAQPTQAHVVRLPAIEAAPTPVPLPTATPLPTMTPLPTPSPLPSATPTVTPIQSATATLAASTIITVMITVLPEVLAEGNGGETQAVVPANVPVAPDLTPTIALSTITILGILAAMGLVVALPLCVGLVLACTLRRKR